MNPNTLELFKKKKMQKSRGGVKGGRGQGGCEPRIEVIVKMQKSRENVVGVRWGRGSRVQVRSGDLVGGGSGVG